jgi:tetratricopeptide (TPR) repeat protein
MTKTIFYGFIFCITGPAAALSTEAIHDNNAAVKDLQQKGYFQAYQGFLRSLKAEPFNPKVHLNLGLTFQANEEYDKALQEYNLIPRLPGVDVESVFQAYFNAGTLQTKQENIDEALRSYQLALSIRPDSVETKTNIELLLQQQKGKGKGKGSKDKKQDKDQSNNKDNKDQKDKDKDPSKDAKNNDKQNQDGPEKEQKPQKFESQQLSQEDVRKILDEIKDQEQQIRAEINRKEAKEVPRDKNW